MALVNIIAKSKTKIDWADFFKKYNNMNIVDIEVFPIPKELGFESDSIGICVHNGYTDKNKVMLELNRLMIFVRLEPFNLTLIELYNGVEMIPENAIKLVDKLLR